MINTHSAERKSTLKLSRPLKKFQDVVLLFIKEILHGLLALFYLAPNLEVYGC